MAGERRVGRAGRVSFVIIYHGSPSLAISVEPAAEFFTVAEIFLAEIVDNKLEWRYSWPDSNFSNVYTCSVL